MARSDKRDNLTVSDRPFARVLTAYMWSKQPPWSATRLANALGMGRARVVNWIYHNTDPDLATMLAVMAQLNIPTTTLLRAYEEAGLPTPPLTGDEAAAQPSTQPSTQPPAMPQQQQLPSASETPPVGEAQTQVDAQDDAQAETDAEWQTMLNHTRLVLRRTGMLDATIEALLSTLDADRDETRSQGHSSREQRIAEEMDQPAYQAHRPTAPSTTPSTTPPTTPSRPATKR